MLFLFSHLCITYKHALLVFSAEPMPRQAATEPATVQPVVQREVRGSLPPVQRTGVERVQRPIHTCSSVYFMTLSVKLQINNITYNAIEN